MAIEKEPPRRKLFIVPRVSDTDRFMRQMGIDETNLEKSDETEEERSLRLVPPQPETSGNRRIVHISVRTAEKNGRRVLYFHRDTPKTLPRKVGNILVLNKNIDLNWLIILAKISKRKEMAEQRIRGKRHLFTLIEDSSSPATELGDKKVLVRTSRFEGGVANFSMAKGGQKPPGK